MKIHQEEKYDCKTCKKLFKSKTGLSQHELSHNGLRPFKCKMCDLKGNENFLRPRIS